jgi:hypothetical protein
MKQNHHGTFLGSVRTVRVGTEDTSTGFMQSSPRVEGLVSGGDQDKVKAGGEDLSPYCIATLQG